MNLVVRGCMHTRMLELHSIPECGCRYHEIAGTPFFLGALRVFGMYLVGLSKYRHVHDHGVKARILVPQWSTLARWVCEHL